MIQGFKLATLAFELGLITRDQMCLALVAWLPQQEKSLSVLMVEAGYLLDSDRDLLDRLAQRHAESISSADFDLQPIRQHLAALTVGNSASPALREAAQTLSRTLRETSPPERNAEPETSVKSDGSTTEEFVARSLTELNASSHRFRLVKPYAVGGLGVVSVAHDVELDREVAVKEIRPNATSDDAVQRFLLEARVTGQLDHPGIPPVYALGYFEDGRPFYVMRLIEGVTLKEAIAAFHARFPSPDTSRERSLELRKLLGAMVSVCNTLRFAHSRNVLHRDIKPSNIMLGEYGETLVLDWGLAKNKEQSQPFSINDAKAHSTKRKADDATQTGTGSVMGTPHYMSPEQARGEWESVNVRSDVYSVGATLYTLLTGRLPFAGSTRDEVCQQVRQGSFTRPRQVDARVPGALDAICVKAMALQREDRFANTGELASEIEHWLADEPVSSFREPALQRWQRWIKARQSLVASLILLLASGFVILAAGFIFVSSQFQTVSQATVEAVQLNRKSAQQLTDARKLLLSKLLIDIDQRLSLTPGTELVRIEMIDEAIELLGQWSQSEPLNAQYQLNLAGAYRQRHRVHLILNQHQAAWSDLIRSLGIVEPCLMARDVKIRSKATLFRNLLLNDAAATIVNLEHDDQALQFAVEVRARISRMFERHISDDLSKIRYVEINLVVARLLLERGQSVQATEIADESCTILEGMASELNHKSADSKVDVGPAVIHGLTMETHKLQAFSAFAIGDYERALHHASVATEMINAALEREPMNQVHAENALAMQSIDFSITAQFQTQSADQLQEKCQALVERGRMFNRLFPNNRNIVGLLNEAFVHLVDLQLDKGMYDRAIETALGNGTVHSPVVRGFADRHLTWARVRLSTRLAEALINKEQHELASLFLMSAMRDLTQGPLKMPSDFECELARLNAACALVSDRD